MPNTEIELKYKISDIKIYEDKLKNLGAKFQKEYQMSDTYYIMPKNIYLRVRQKGDKSELNYHEASSDTHTQEWETAINDPQMMNEIIQKLGFKIDVIVAKKRSIYHYKNSEIVIDDVQNLGLFLEIESPDLPELEAIQSELGLTKSDQISGAGYSDMFRAAQKKE